MRLGQLARKLDIKTDEIVSYIKDNHKVEINKHPNAKVPDEYLEELEAAFINTTTQPEHVNEELVVKKEVIKAQESKDEPIEKTETVVEQEPEEVVTETVQKLKELKTSTTGPKILGKIDLPDDSKQMIEIDGVMYEKGELEKKKKEEKERLKAQHKKEQEAKKQEEELKRKLEKEKREVERLRKENLSKNEEHIKALEEQKRLEKLEKQRIERQKKLIEKQKKKQKEHYLKKHANQVKKDKKKPLKANKIAEEVIEETPQTQDTKNLSLFKRFLLWLNKED